MKRMISSALAIVLLLSCGGTAFAQNGSEHFTDVSADEWYAPYIDICYEMGLMQGVGDGEFDPQGALSCAEMFTACARLHNVLGGGDGKLPVMPEEEKDSRYTGAWYDDTMWYWDKILPELDLDDDIMELAHEIERDYPEVDFTSFTGARADCPRAVLACMLALTLYDESLSTLNPETTIPDFDYEPVRRLYSAGILGGVDKRGTFDGHGTLTRSQLAAVIARVVEPELRLKYAPPSFDFDLLAQMPQGENYMVSPISLKIAMAMAANGASGATQQEILDVLEIADLEEFNEEIQAFIEGCNANEEVKLNVANSIWYNSDHLGGAGSFAPGFAKIIEEKYDGIAETITNDNGAKTINDWISEQTNDKIKDMVTDDTVRQNLSFLVNAIYFKGDWLTPFKAESTRDRLFTSRDGTGTTIAFMNDTDEFDYYENDSFQMLAKPYMDREIQMYFILPKDDTALTQEQFETALSDMTSERVYFSVPKFKTEYLHENLTDILKYFGINSAFSDRSADFGGMFDGIGPDVVPYINTVLQKTFIEVDEKGTEAAAVTIIGMNTASAAVEPDPIDFICDRPFIYIIRDDSTGTILFMGEYAFAQ